MKEIQLTHGMSTLVDEEDYILLNKYKWHVKRSHNTYYAMRKPYKSHIILMHRVILGVPDNLEADHIDGNGLDNRKKNLRIVTHRENSQNRHQLKKKTSRFTGVDWYKSRGKWRAQIRMGGNSKHLGLFSCEEDARLVYASMAAKLKKLERW